jgi:hypothetical protein
MPCAYLTLAPHVDHLVLPVCRHADFNIAGNQFGDQSNTTGEDKDVHVESEERGGGSGLVGRRVRDVQAFDLLCELWTASHTCADDQLRLQLLDMVCLSQQPCNLSVLKTLLNLRGCGRPLLFSPSTRSISLRCRW